MAIHVVISKNNTGTVRGRNKTSFSDKCKPVMNNFQYKPRRRQYSNCTVLLITSLSVFISTLVYDSSRVKQGLMPLFIPYLFRHPLEIIISLKCNEYTSSHFAAERQAWLPYVCSKAEKRSGVHRTSWTPGNLVIQLGEI